MIRAGPAVPYLHTFPRKETAKQEEDGGSAQGGV